MLIASTDAEDNATLGSTDHPLRISEIDTDANLDEESNLFKLEATPEGASVRFRYGRIGDERNYLLVDRGDRSRRFERPQCWFQPEGFAEDDWQPGTD